MEPIMSPSTMPSSSSIKRILGETPITEDLSRVTFSQANKFIDGEIVLVPRSKGGFVYGRVVKKTKYENCLFGSSISHSSAQLRVEYPDKHSQQDLFKALPPSMIGKVPSSEQLNSHTKVSEYRRELGGPATLRDLNSVVFSLASHFTPGEFVLVSRSHGGFTYGEITCSQSVNCPFAPRDSRHPVDGWRIFIDANKSMKKELSPESIGKITAVVHSNSETSIIRQNDRKKYTNKRRVEKEFSKISEELGETLPVTIAQSTDGQIKRMQSLSKNKHETNVDLSVYVSPQATTSRPSLPHSAVSRARATLTNCTHNSADNLFAAQKLLLEEEDEEEDSLEEEILIWNQPLSISPPNADKSSDSPAPIEPSADQQEAASPSKKGIIEIPANISLRSPKKIPFSSGKRNNKTNRDRKPQKNGEKCVVIIDAPNVAVKHGKGKFSTKGIVNCVNYWRERGHKVTAFLPENYIHPNGNELPKVDDIPAIKKLIDQEIIFLTPSQDYDDSYCIAYAKNKNGIIVTNDLYRDHIEKQSNKHEVRKWIKSHCVSFTFVIDDFFPNPDFILP